MQLTLEIDPRADALLRIDARLRARFALHVITTRHDPVGQLVKGIIGGRTRSEVAGAALHHLKEGLGSWERLCDTPIGEIERYISAVTFSEAKAPYVRASLRQIKRERGRIDLSFLACWSVRDGMAWLERLPGVGRKASASVLNASVLQRRALVLDTHHLRALRRLGLIGPGCDTVRAYDTIMPLLPSEWSAEDIDDHHRRYKRLGQTYCRHDTPLCESCPLSGLCPTGRAAQKRRVARFGVPSRRIPERVRHTV
ncbi:hypothetical protein [uncultured Algimonas sp.]|uniref:endonuclease III domain-containing protein n=1 Tax=uncultured Algimonas sp. TaxID=1547920 RepID=UPI002625C10A|nr:hypothetical protein [uncultured Algimonas sp.]